MGLHARFGWCIASLAGFTLAGLLCAPDAYAAAYSGGSGTEADPYLVSTPQDLLDLANPDNEGDWDEHFRMTNDIDMSAVTGFTPIAPDTSPDSYRHEGTRFTGVFAGGGYAVQGLVIDLPGQYYVGLFAYVDGSAGEGTGEVANLGIEGGSVTGGHYVGGLVGYNGGAVTECYATGAVSGVYGAGGLAGYNAGTMTECFATGSVSSDDYYAGGLAGINYGTVTACYATGAVVGDETVGGLAGYDRGAIEACYATGLVSGDFEVGGLVGADDGIVSASFWDTATSGQAGSGGGMGLSTAGMKTVTYYQNAGWSALAWVMTSGAYPRLAWEGTGDPAIPASQSIPLSGSGTEGDPYLVGTPAEFAALSWHVGYLDTYLRLTADLDCGAMTLHPVGVLGPFTGDFDGDGHVIRNASITEPGSDYVGVFSVVDAGGVIHDLGIEDNAIVGRSYVGGLAGRNGGTVQHCYATGDVSGTYWGVGGLVGWNNGGSIEGCHATGTVLGIDTVGGLVGYNTAGTVDSCYALGVVACDEYDVGGLVGYNSGTVTACYAAGMVIGGDQAGGLAGSNRGPVTACYATVDVTGDEDVGGLVGDNRGAVTACYATGAVTGGSNAGGLVGSSRSDYYYQSDGTALASFWDVETSGQDQSDGGEGLPTSAMQMRATYQDAIWGLYGVWVMDEGAYPRLAWEGTGGTPLTPPFAGDGTASSPFEISSLVDLVVFAGNPILWDKHFLMTQDMDMTGVTGSGPVAPDLDLTSGHSGTKFTGVFDGGGHVIRNLVIDRPGDEYVAPIAYLDGSGGAGTGEIRNLGIEGRDHQREQIHGRLGRLQQWRHGDRVLRHRGRVRRQQRGRVGWSHQ